MAEFERVAGFIDINRDMGSARVSNPKMERSIRLKKI
jgi:hypothetical protein